MAITSTPPGPLHGKSILIPRGGRWGVAVYETLRSRGALPVLAPLIDFAPARDTVALDYALYRLEAGEFDWVTVTSATTVGILRGRGVRIPASTRIAAVGEPTRDALEAGRFGVDLLPASDHSARGMVAEFRARDIPPGRVLTLSSEIARPTLVDGLRAAGHTVEAVTSYRTIPVNLSAEVIADLAAGRIDAVLLTSGSVAAGLAAQATCHPDTVLAAIGDRTAEDARARGLNVAVESSRQSVAGLIAALEEFYAAPEGEKS